MCFYDVGFSYVVFFGFMMSKMYFYILDFGFNYVIFG